MRTVSDSELKELTRSGAKVTVRKSAKKEEKATDSVGPVVAQQAAATLALANELGKGQTQLVEKLTTVLKNNQNNGVKPTPYRFTINRDKRGLIDSIDAYPIEED